uniref:C2H2-type domain-containing protein n=1 Tax=Caenorhabditis tropicalis TaxID=1561998 RepID=A0A1I7UD70_9PELO
MLQLRSWSDCEDDYFSFLDRKDSPNGVSTVVICRLCDHKPFSGRTFFEHLFSPSHTEKLSAFMIAERSFSFWKDHIERCRGITVTVPLARQPSENNEFTEENKGFELSDSLVFKTIPLFSSGVSKEKEKLSASEVDLLVNLMMRIDAQNWRGERDCLSMFIKTVSRPKFCDLCQYNVKTYNFARHMMSKRHLNALTGVSQKEFNFWVNLLTLESDSTIDPADRMRILHKKNTRPIPLLDFKIESLLIEKPYRDEKINELQESLKNINKEQLVHVFGPSNSHEEIACFACNLPKNHFKSQSELIFHIFSEQHVKYMNYAASIEDLDFWKNWANSILEYAKETTPEPAPPTVAKEVTPEAALSEVVVLEPIEFVKVQSGFGFIILGNSNYCISDNPCVPMLDEMIEGETAMSNDPRIPLLDVLQSQSGALSKSEYESKLKTCQVIYQFCTESKATRQKVNCTCYHCPGNHRMTTIHEIMDHVFLSDHARMINYQGSAADFSYYHSLMKTMPKRYELSTPQSGEEIPVETPENKKPPTGRKAKAPKKTPPVLVVNPIRAPINTACTVPLFKTPSSSRQTPETRWFGPTNVQYEALLQLKSQETACFQTRLQLPKCEACDIDMSGWSMLEIALHGFSVTHLHKYQSMGGWVRIEDYDFWIQIISTSLVISPPSSNRRPIRMGVVVDFSYGSKNSSELTSYEKALISNMDVNELNRYTVMITASFGGCLHCDVWLLSPVEVVNHFSSDAQLKKTRGIGSIDGIMDYVKHSQKQTELIPFLRLFWSYFVVDRLLRMKILSKLSGGQAKKSKIAEEQFLKHLETVGQLTKSVDKNRSELRTTLTVIGIGILIRFLSSIAFFVFPYHPEVTEAIMLYMDGIFIFTFCFYLSPLKHLNWGYCRLKCTFIDFGNSGLTDEQWKELFPIMRYRECFLDFFYVALIFIYYICHIVIVTTLWFLIHPLRESIGLLVLIIVHSSVCLLIWFFFLLRTFTTLRELRKTLSQCRAPDF